MTDGNAAAVEQQDGIFISIVDPLTARKYWRDSYYPLIAKALEHSPVAGDTPGEALNKIADCSAVLLQIDDGRELLAVCLVELIPGKVGQLLHVYALAGSQRERWLGKLIERLKKTAQEMGAASVSMSGRPGWLRELPQYGWRTELVTMTMRAS